jgi:hypothetical protein
MKLIIPVSTALLLTLYSNNALAEDFKKWGDAGSWRVFVDASVGNGCLIEKTFEDGSRMRMGHLPEKDGAYLSVVNKSWTHIEEAETVVVHFDLDGVVFGGDVEYLIEGDWRGGYAFFNNPALVDKFARKNLMTITGPSNQPVSYSLTGTTAALSALHECRKKNQN